MTLLNWMKYCRDRLSDKYTADDLNNGEQFRWIDEGEEGDCANCNPWYCISCCDGFGLSCGRSKVLWYYIPDPYDRSDCLGSKDWKKMIKDLPSPDGVQLSLF